MEFKEGRRLPTIVDDVNSKLLLKVSKVVELVVCIVDKDVSTSLLAP
jgi:hypothetical protein